MTLSADEFHRAVVNDDLLGSMEFACAVAGAKLILLFGHTACGAIKGAIALKGARTLGIRLEEEPHVNPNTRTMEFSLLDPDGYYVTVSALSAPGPREDGPS